MSNMSPADTPENRILRRGLAGLFSRFASLALGLIWILFIGAPFYSSPGMREGIFVPSDEWNAHAPWAIAQGTLLGFLIFSAMVALTCAFAVFLIWNTPHAPSVKKGFFWFWAGSLILLPFWGWGMERGHMRVWAHEGAPTIDRVFTTAIVNTYYVTQSGRRRRADEPHLLLQVPPFGRLEIKQHPKFVEGFRPTKGETLAISGRRTWVGTYYEDVEWPRSWLQDYAK